MVLVVIARGGEFVHQLREFHVELFLNLHLLERRNMFSGLLEKRNIHETVLVDSTSHCLSLKTIPVLQNGVREHELLLHLDVLCKLAREVLMELLIVGC